MFLITSKTAYYILLLAIRYSCVISYCVHILRFTKKLSSAKTLLISYIGMQTMDVAIKPNLRVILKPDAKQLDEVMVVAYGTSKKSSFTGSAAVVKADKIEKLQASNVTKALDGAVAGVQLTASSGAPGSKTSIRVRGLGSINASSEPLIVVDGVPYDGDLSMISQQDVESMTVLKDASANALYGARGANGVVLITTKKGAEGKSTISVDIKLGANTRGVPEYDVMTNPAEYYSTYWRALKGLYEADGQANPGELASKNLIAAKSSGLGYNVTNVANDQVVLPDGTFNPNAKILYQDDWTKELFNSGLRQEYNVNMSGATDKTSYYMSFGYLNDEGYVVNSGFERYSGRLRMEHQFTNWLKAGGNFSYVNTATTATSATEEQDQTAGSNMFYVSRTMAPIYPVYDRDKDGNIRYDSRNRPVYDYGSGAQKRPHLGNSNALGSQNLDKRTYTNDYFSGNMFAEATFLKDFKFTFRVGVENQNERSMVFQNGEYGQFVAQNGIASHTSDRNMTVNLQELLTWGRTFGDHRVDVLAGHETYQTKYEYLYGSKNNFALWGSTALDQAVSNPQASSYSTEYSTEGFLGRVEYNFRDKYYFSGSYRRDASSVFHPDYRWGNFWSVGASWRLKEESFLQDINWLSNLKYKISYGSQGNDYLLKADKVTRNRYAYLDQFEVVNNNGQPAINQIYKGNDKLKWETNYNFNTGIEFGVLDNRLSGSFDFFTRYAKDLLFNRPLAASSGITSYPDNIGDMRNMGVELELSADIIKTNKINWNVSVNATHYKNKILSLPPEKKESGVWNGIFKMVEGGSYYDYYIKEWAGVDPQDGAAMWYKDEKGADGKISKVTTKNYSDGTDYNVATALPKVYGGFNTALEAFGFDLSLNFSYQIGGKGMDYTYAGLMHSGTSAGYNFHRDILEAWSPENPNTDVPKLNTKSTSDNSTSSRFLVDASYLSLQNISFGYTLPKSCLRKIGCSNVRFYFVADNVALLSGRTGYDPRMNWNGESKYNYSALRTISGGLSLKF